jgi:hypothetical protein
MRLVELFYSSDQARRQVLLRMFYMVYSKFDQCASFYYLSLSAVINTIIPLSRN